MGRLVLPACLVLLLVGTNLPSILRLSPRALGAMAAGSAGIFLGGIVTFLMGNSKFDDFWKGWACLSASWTGGSANMLSANAILQPPETLFANLVIVDTVIAYSWMAFLVYLSRFQKHINRWLRAQDSGGPENEIKSSSTPSHKSKGRTFALLIFAFTLAGFFWLASGKMPAVGDILNRSTWLVIFATLVPLGLSLTPAAKLESWGAGRTGNFLLFLLLTSIGARASLAEIWKAPVLILLGFYWALMHGAVLIFYGKLTRTPMSLLAAASQANIGGTASAPLVAGIYDSKLVSAGLILAVCGNIYGTAFAVAFSEVCRRLTGLL